MEVDCYLEIGAVVEETLYCVVYCISERKIYADDIVHAKSARDGIFRLYPPRNVLILNEHRFLPMISSKNIK